jgi:hypothetical protein
VSITGLETPLLEISCRRAGNLALIISRELDRPVIHWSGELSKNGNS